MSSETLTPASDANPPGGRSQLAESTCAIARAMFEVGDPWSILIIRDAQNGLRRFGEFRASLGVAKNILSDRLKRLVGHGVLEMAPASDGSAFQEYVLTEKGRALGTVVVALWQWGEAYCFSGEAPESILCDLGSGLPLAPIELRASNGRRLDLENVGLAPRVRG